MYYELFDENNKRIDGKVHFAADFHINDSTVFDLERRKFLSIENMNNHYIELIKETLSDPSHHLFNLGDYLKLRHGAPLNFEILDIFKPFKDLENTKHILLKGNHDEPVTNIFNKNQKLINKVGIYNILEDYIRLHLRIDLMITYDIYITHNPHTFNDGRFQDCILLHGHCHGSLGKDWTKYNVLGIDCGINVWNKIPSMDDILPIIERYHRGKWRRERKGYWGGVTRRS